MEILTLTVGLCFVGFKTPIGAVAGGRGWKVTY
jgi:hypothetical protein